MPGGGADFEGVGRVKKKKYLQLYLDHFDEPEMWALRDKFGDTGQLSYMLIASKLMGKTSGILDQETVFGFWRYTSSTKEVWIEIVNFLVGCGWLTLTDGNISSIGVEENRKEADRKSKQATANGKLGGRGIKAEQNQSESETKPNEKQIEGRNPSTYTYTSNYLGKKIRIENPEWSALVMNNFQGNEKAAREMCEDADDYCEANAKTFQNSSSCAAYIRSWKKRGMQWQREKPAAKAEPKNLAASKGPPIVVKISDEARKIALEEGRRMMAEKGFLTNEAK
jgi:hypothetical protein